MLSPMMRSIRGQLAELGLSQHDLAAALGISQSTLNAMLNGRRPARAGFEAQAAEALDRLERVELAAAAAREQAVAGGAARAREEEVAATATWPHCGRAVPGGRGGAAALLAVDDQAPAAGAHLPGGAHTGDRQAAALGARRPCWQWLAVDGRSASPTGRRRRRDERRGGSGAGRMRMTVTARGTHTVYRRERSSA